MRAPIINRLMQCFSAFHADKSGIALIYVTVALPVIIGFSLLAIDVGRLSTLQSTLQHGADALALAGAGELDRGPDAITRANYAIDHLLNANAANSNVGLFSASPVTINGAAVPAANRCYLDVIPNDTTAIDPLKCLSNTAVLAERARYVQVTVIPQTFNTIFPVGLVGTATTTSSAKAVAGFDAAACNFTPIFMCNPFEPTTGTTDTFDDYGLASHVADYIKRRKQIKFVSVGTGASVPGVPGQFGFLDPAVGHGKNPLGNEIAATIPDVCFLRKSLTTKAGSMTDLIHAFNVRFDMYFGNYKKVDYPPAGNVRKGYVVSNPANGNAAGNACKSSDNTLATNSAQYLGLPADSCFLTTCSPSNIGNGDWGWDPDIPGSVSFDTYWNTNFKNVPKPSYADLGIDSRTSPVTAADPPPRYEVYVYENTHDYNGKKLRASPSVGSGTLNETGLPNCSVGNGIDTPDRRIIYGAIINCRAEGLSTGNSGGTNGYRAVAFGKYFMTRPMTSPSASNLWTELVALVYPGDNTGVNRDRVQLYR